MDKKAEIIKNSEGKTIVLINDIRLKGKRKIDWCDVEKYLKKYIGKFFQIEKTADIVYIGSEFPDEFSGSKDTARLKGTLAKAKANASQAIEEIIESADFPEYAENRKQKHKHNARYGWYRYTSRFALPVCSDAGEIERYNVFCVQMIVRHDQNGKKYLYDLINIKKESSTPHCR